MAEVTASDSAQRMAAQRAVAERPDDLKEFTFYATLAAPVAEALAEEDVFKDRRGFLVSFGSGSYGFYAEQAATALCKRVEAGNTPEAAIDWLERALALEDVDAATVALLWGVKVIETVEVGPNLSLMPIDALPDSSARNYALDESHRGWHRLPLPMTGLLVYPPGAALLLRHKIRPVIIASTTTEDSSRLIMEVTHRHLLIDDAVLALTLVGPSCVVNYGTFTHRYSSDLDEATFPMGMSRESLDVMPWGYAPPYDLAASTAAENIGRFAALSGSFKDRMRLAARRLNQALRRSPRGDGAIDVAITLESVMVDGAGENTFKTALRTALIVTEDRVRRREVRAIVNSVYALRSALVHSGTMPQHCVVKGRGQTDSGTVVREAIVIAAEALRALVRRGEAPDWSYLDIGAESPEVR